MKIPEVGKTYNFYDDGKLSRNYANARVIRIISVEEAKDIKFPAYIDEDGLPCTYYNKTWCDQYDYCAEKSLYEIWQDEIENHLQEQGFIVLNGSCTAIGEPWLYSRDTPCFVEVEIPEYDEFPIWFIKTANNTWFSLNIQSSWQAGLLDVENKIITEYGKD